MAGKRISDVAKKRDVRDAFAQKLLDLLEENGVKAVDGEEYGFNSGTVVVVEGFKSPTGYEADLKITITAPAKGLFFAESE